MTDASTKEIIISMPEDYEKYAPKLPTDECRYRYYFQEPWHPVKDDGEFNRSFIYRRIVK